MELKVDDRADQYLMKSLMITRQVNPQQSRFLYPSQTWSENVCGVLYLNHANPTTLNDKKMTEFNLKVMH